MYERVVLAIIRENLDSDGRLPRDFTLPKDPDDESGLLFADGAQDGITYFHTQPVKLYDEEADLLVDALNEMLRTSRYTGRLSDRMVYVAAAGR